MLYNCVLAFLNAHGMRQSFGTVAAVEILILAVTAFYLLLADAIDLPAAAIILYGVAVSFFVTFASQGVSADCLRSMLIIAVFSTIGRRIDADLLLTTLRIVSLLVLTGLVLEIAATQLYVQIFQPASYYANTRGIAELSVDSSGLFRNALGFKGRFSFGLSDHRTASFFIEQVSLANFAGVLTIVLLSLFPRLGVLDRLLHVGLLVLILLTNDTRTSSLLTLISLVGYVIYPLLDTAVALLVMPAILTCGFLANLLFGPGPVDAASDDARGRLALTMNHLAAFDWPTLLGFNARIAPTLMDSGYAFVIASSTVFGLAIIWLAIVFAVPAHNASQRRCLFGLNLYFFCNLMIGGTAVFSIKVAAPLWLLVGFMAAHPAMVPGPPPRMADAPRWRRRLTRLPER